MKRLYIVITLLIYASCGLVAVAQSADSILTVASGADTIAHKTGFINKVINYFKESNKPKTYRGLDFSVIGGPHYSSDTKLGLGVVAAGFYRNDPQDSITGMSNVSIYGDVSTVGFYMLGVRGNHIFTDDRDRIDYNLYFYSFPRKFWGIGFEQGLNMDNRSNFHERYVHASINYLHSMAPHLYFGPGADYAYTNATDVERPELWQGQRMHNSAYGVGFKLQYDTRDNFTETQHGMLASLEQRFMPKFLGNRYAFSFTELTYSYFRTLWKGGVFAGQFHGMFNYGNVPWGMMATFGGSHTMRGYYEGRFRDKCEMDVTLELRQHVWNRNGLVVWVGAGTVFDKFSQIQMRRMLPNGGIGYRWEFKQRTNVRLDYGLARGESSFIFSINEAF